MTHNVSIEQMFATDYRNKLKEKVDSVKEHIVSNPLPQDEYLQHVGYARGLTESLDDFENLIKAYFARE